MTTLGEVAAITDCEHKTAPTCEPSSRFAWSIGTKAIRNGTIQYDQARPVDRDTYAVFSGRRVPAYGDLILAREAPVGGAVLVPAHRPVCLGQRTVLVSPDPDVLDHRYLFYALRSPGTQAWMKVHSEGSTVKHLNVRDIWQIPLGALPDVTEQHRIAGVLRAFDDLIETNWQTADALAQLAALAFQQATKDQPEAELGDLVSLVYGKALPAPRRNPGPVPVVSSAGISGYHNEALVSGPGVVVGRKGTVGSVTWVPTDFYPIDTAFYAESDLPPEIVYHLLAAAGLSDLNSDSAVPGLNRDRALCQPSPDIRGQTAESIQGWLKPLMSGADELRSEADELARGRDELLPLLMSGQVRVSEVEGVG